MNDKTTNVLVAGVGGQGVILASDIMSEVFMEAGVQDLAKVFQIEALVGGVVRNADPGDIALTDMLDSARAIDEIVDLSLQYRLEVLLHLASSNLDDDAHIHNHCYCY